jgi:hypothetical protein
MLQSQNCSFKMLLEHMVLEQMLFELNPVGANEVIKTTVIRAIAERRRYMYTNIHTYIHAHTHTYIYIYIYIPFETDGNDVFCKTCYHKCFGPTELRVLRPGPNVIKLFSP